MPRSLTQGGCDPQTAVVVTFLHVPGVPPFTHTNSAPAESMYISPLVCAPLGLPRLLAATSFNCALPPSKLAPPPPKRPCTGGRQP